MIYRDENKLVNVKTDRIRTNSRCKLENTKQPICI